MKVKKPFSVSESLLTSDAGALHRMPAWTPVLNPDRAPILKLSNLNLILPYLKNGVPGEEYTHVICKLSEKDRVFQVLSFGVARSSSY